ncbi:MAG TPA: YbaN family protein [Micropepsaceae bacterium]|nr:YbaN family protein [Micropepsaceae bacterium]
MQRLARPLWILSGLVALALGALGAVLPLLPTTPFILLSAFCFARSSPRLHDWLLTHRIFGPLILNWEREGAISRRAKIAAVSMMAITPVITILIGAPIWALLAQIAVLAGAATFVLTRPSPSNNAN